MNRARRSRRARADARFARDVSFVETTAAGISRRLVALAAFVIAWIAIAGAIGGHEGRADAADAAWRASYYANIWLAGDPVLTRDEGTDIDATYDGATRPAPGVPAHWFSVRWTRTETFDTGGLYRFSVTADDGIRVLVDGETVLDEWFDQSATSYDVSMRVAAGEHQLEVEYYNNLYEGRARFAVELIEADTPTPTPPPTETQIPTSTRPPDESPGPAPASTGTPVVTEVSLSHERTASKTATRTATPTRTPASTPTPLPGSPRPPRIECKWELPDMDSDEPGIQYLPRDESAVIDAVGDPPGNIAPSDLAGTHTYDDDMAVHPTRDRRHHDDDDHDDDEAPCDISTHEEPDQPDGVRHAIQVVPNPGDEPEQRRIELWLAASHPDGNGAIGSAFWVVYRPDGSQMAVVPGAPVSSSDCDGRGHGRHRPGSMFDAAASTGQLSRRAVDDEHKGVHGRCHAGRAAVYRGEFRLSVSEPCGEYRVDAVAVSTGGAPAQLTNYIDVLCVFALKIDFRSVDWGDITPGERDVVAGDTQFRPRTDIAPTVKNAGNDGMGLRIRFSPLRSTPGFRIDEFDACFGRSDASLQCIDPIAAGAATSFDRDPARVLCGNERARLDLGMHPAAGLAPGAYRGLLSLVGFHVGGECAGARHLH